MEKQLSRMHGAFTPFFAWIAFALAFFIITQAVPAETADISSYSILEFFKKYSHYAGVGIGLLAFLSMLILMGLATLFRLKNNRFFMPIILILGFFPWLIFGYQLVFVEPRYANLAKAIIAFLGQPMLYGSALMTGFGLLWLVALFFLKPKP